MKGDFSKLDFNPADNFTGVLYQQGRVFSDQDGNAEAQIEGHLRTALAQDAIGSNVAAVPAAVADSFKVTEAASDGTNVTVTFKPGRVWADGVPLQAGGTADLVLQAPYFGPPIQNPMLAVSSIAAGVRDAVILEVWEEAFSAYQDPAQLIEPALGGVDTTERVKVQFGLKLLRLGPGDDCGNLADRLADDFDAKGKLTVSPSASATITGDCPVAVGGGYNGFEHFLYRIEIATPTTTGARFKWSQFNGGLVGRGVFTSTGATTGTVDIRANNQMINHCGLPGFYLEALKYDSVLGHWHVVFSADATLPQNDTLSLTNTNGTWPASAPNTAFFRLWNGIEYIGNFPIPSGSAEPNELVTGLGIRLAFDATATGNYTAGDYWTFPVRASGANVDAAWIAANWPNNAAPDGIHYHRAPLAILNWNDDAPVTITAPGQISDCRRVFQPLTKRDSCCTYTVGDGLASFGGFDTIQDAINALPVTGGTICVLPGSYTENLIIDGKNNVTIRGCGLRSKVLSDLPSSGGTAQPVITISGALNTRIESLALFAHSTGVGVFLSEKPEAHHTLLRDLFISASTRSAIDARGGTFLTIEHCRILMNDTSSPWPGIFVIGEDMLIERNTIQIAPRDFGSAAPVANNGFNTSIGTAGRGGLQIGGTSERVRVVNNLIKGGIGNGITLGTLRQIDDDDGDGVVIGWPIDPFDPCDPCNPGDGYVPPGGADPEFPGFESAGTLYDILIERNRILSMGMNGIGVVAFFSLAQQDEFISVDGLRILGNEIRNCLRRPIAAIPSHMQNAMGYGGISLADVENLVINHNKIEDNGPSHIEPVCGVFVLHGEGIDISDNRILNNGAKILEPSASAKGGRRGGINIVLAITPTVPTTINNKPVPIDNGVPAAKIHDNIVSQPVGRALWLSALGPVSVMDNHFTSQGLAGTPSLVAATVYIQNLGMSNEFFSQLTNYSGAASYSAYTRANSNSVYTGNVNNSDATDSVSNSEYMEIGGNSGPQNIYSAPTIDASGIGVLMAGMPGLDDKLAGSYLANGSVHFNDNRVDLNLLETGMGVALSSIAIFSLDDVGFADNQCSCNLLDDYVFVHTILFGISVRMADNRLKEGMPNALYSGMTIGFFNATTNNQSTHCLLVYGLIPALKVDSGNKALVQAFSDNYCDQGKNGLSNAGFMKGVSL